MRRPIIAGNWKMNMTTREAAALVDQLKAALHDYLPVEPGGQFGGSAPSLSKSGGRHPEREASGQRVPSDAGRGPSRGIEVVVCPPFTALSSVSAQLSKTAIALGAQDLFWEPHGAFTGEVSGPMLLEVGCHYCIIGHSERRQSFGETDEVVRRKLVAANQHGLLPILCVGETLTEREQGKTFEVLSRQLGTALSDGEHWNGSRLIIAYEPVWAIGTGKNATPDQAQEAHRFIRQWVAKRCGVEAAQTLRIQYGGSVSSANAASLLQQPDVDGALVGGASLKAESFVAIVKAAAEAKQLVNK